MVSTFANQDQAICKGQKQEGSTGGCLKLSNERPNFRGVLVHDCGMATTPLPGGYLGLLPLFRFCGFLSHFKVLQCFFGMLNTPLGVIIFS